MKVLVIGYGTMGRGICSLLRRKKIEHTVKLRKGKELKEGFIDDYSSVNMYGYDFIIETVSEDISKKKDVYAELSQFNLEDTPILSNTSSIRLDLLGMAYKYPRNVVGFHFFNPPAKINTVEVFYQYETKDEMKKSVEDFAETLSMHTVFVENKYLQPGYIVNKLLFSFFNHAIQLVDQKVATPEEIDEIMKQTLKHPMGPFELMDMIGLDVCNNIMQNLFLHLGERFSIPSLLNSKVGEHKLGRKSGEGFYKY